MLQHLTLKDVGPAPSMAVDFAPRLNLLTGDNGLGKTFLLDVAWWALTRTWARAAAAPNRADGTYPSINFRLGAGQRERTGVFDWATQDWVVSPSLVPSPQAAGLVIYALVEGGFAVWDPARNPPSTDGSRDAAGRPAAYVFKPEEVWDGLPLGAGKKLCNGLIADWGNWQREQGAPFKELTRALEHLSPSPRERLVPGELVRISLDDVRDHPTLRMPYGQDVALVHASAGMRRIVALAYLLVWTWQEHLRAAQLLRMKPAREIVFLVDEIEAHLHPQWQRRIVPSLLSVVESLTREHDMPVQLIATTHAPMVMASLEPLFSDSDAWLDLDLVSSDGQCRVQLTKRPWVRHGDATAWLTSEAFDLPSARSLEAEQLIEEASRALADESFDRKRAKKLHTELRKVLGDTDPFWMNWRYVGQKKGWLP